MKNLARAALLSAAAFLVGPYLVPLRRHRIPHATLADPNGRFVSIDGVQIYLREWGPCDGVPLLLFHGTVCSTGCWYRNSDALAAAGYRVIAFDRPGSGLSDKPLRYDYSHAAMADLTLRLMDVLGVTRVVAMGHSAGANVALHLAHRTPQRVRKLVIVDGLIAIPGGPPPWVAGLFALPPLARWAQIGFRLRMTPKLFASAFADPRNFDAEHSTGIQATLQTNDWDRALVATFRDSAGNILTADELRRIDTPTLVVWGAADRWVPVAIGTDLCTALPNAQWRLYPAVGHFAMEEAAEAFNADLLAFLKTEAEG